MVLNPFTIRMFIKSTKRIEMVNTYQFDSFPSFLISAGPKQGPYECFNDYKFLHFNYHKFFPKNRCVIEL